MMGDRRTARELALQALFYCDMEGVDPAGRLQLFCDNYKDLITESVEPFFLDLVNGVIKFSEQVNNIISQSSKNWKVSRMPVVDRNIMRIAVYELLHRSDIPHSVTINEAVEIGKKYGTRDSGPFINGVLDRIRSMEDSE